MYQTFIGPVTQYATYAVSKPGTTPPISFDDAMTSPTADEFVFIKYLDSSICNFANRTANAVAKKQSISLNCPSCFYSFF